jgi:Tfp pilus assembly major pilin PilA
MNVVSARMPMHAAMARTFVLLAVCITLYATGQQIASTQPAAAAQPVLSSMPPKCKGSKKAMRGKHSNTPPKRKRTALDVRGNHHVTQRALSFILKNVKSKGNVNATSPRSMLRARQAISCRDTPFGKLIQERSVVTKRGGTIQIPFLHPAAMLWVCCKDSNEFKMFFSSVLEGGPRLKLVEYTDEVTPGRELLAYNDKKIWVLYWSFLDFGSAALANEDAWFTGAVVKSSIVRNKVAGGMAQIFKVYNKMFFSEGCDFRSGILMNVPRSPAAAAHADDLPDDLSDLIPPKNTTTANSFSLTCRWSCKMQRPMHLHSIG